MPNPKIEDFTKRELQVINLIAKDKRYKDIAEDLGLHTETIRTYAMRIRKKLGVSSKVGVALWWTKQKDNDGN